MAWTQPVAIFFAVIAALLVFMTLLELRSPSVTRKGFLPLTTTRGDRLFVALLLAAYINLTWTALTDSTQWVAMAISIVATTIVMLRG